MYANLSSLPLAQLSLVPEPDERPLPAARQAVLGTQAWVQPVVVTWRLAGEDRAAVHRVWLTFLPVAGAVRLAGTYDAPPGGSAGPVPGWWLGPVTARRSGGITVVAGSGQNAGRWLALLRPAVAAVRRTLPAELVADRTGAVVVEVPATPADLAALLGQPADRYAQIAGVVYAAGEGDRPPLRMAVSPRMGTDLPADQRSATLRHELVHLATRSPESPAPLWAVEGLAEWVALRDRSEPASTGTADLLASVRRDGAPRALPDDQAFAAGAPGLDRAYAEAWSVARYVADTYSPGRLGRLYAELDRGRSLDEATEAALGLTGAELTVGWRRFLLRQAGTG